MSGKLHLASAFAGREKRAEDGFPVMHCSHGLYSDLDNDYLSWLKTQGWDLDTLLCFCEDHLSHQFPFSRLS